jgi:hypothetical protein
MLAPQRDRCVHLDSAFLQESARGHANEIGRSITNQAANHLWVRDFMQTVQQARDLAYTTSR